MYIYIYIYAVYIWRVEKILGQEYIEMTNVSVVMFFGRLTRLISTWDVGDLYWDGLPFLPAQLDAQMFVCIAGEEVVVWCESWFLSPGMQQLSWPYASWQTPGVLFNQLRVRSSSLTSEGNWTILGVKHAQLQAGQLPSETSNRISSLWKCTAYCLVFVVVEEVLTLRWIGRFQKTLGAIFHENCCREWRHSALL